MYTIVLIYFNQDHQSMEQLFIIVPLLKALNEIDITYYRKFCTTLMALIKSIIAKISTITEILELSNYCYNIDHKTQQLIYYDGN